MAQLNAIGVVVDDQTLSEVRAAIGVLRTLSIQDRKELPKLGGKSTALSDCRPKARVGPGGSP